MAAEAGHAPNRAYKDQSGNLHLNGADMFDAAEKALPQSLSFTPAPGSTNICEVTVQVLDGAGVALAGVFNLDVWLSDAASGAGLTGTSASGTVVAKAASGVDLVTLVSKKALRVQTLATGAYTLAITDSAKTAFLPCGQVPGTGKTVVGAALVTGNYG